MTNENQPKPIAINLMEIWLTGREMERPNALWRPCKRDNTPAAEWRPMNRTVAKRAIRSGVFTVTFGGAQHLFCAREMPATALQLTDYARLKELIGMHKRREALPPLQLPAAAEVPASTLPAMEDVHAPELSDALATVPEGTGPITGGEDGDATLDRVNAAELDRAADSVIADITGQPELSQVKDDAAQGEALGQSPTPMSDNVNSLATDGGVSIPSAGDVAGSTTEESDHHDEQPNDGDRESDRGSEVQGDARAD